MFGVSIDGKAGGESCVGAALQTSCVEMTILDFRIDPRQGRRLNGKEPVSVERDRM